MAISLSYNDDLGRVQVSLSSLHADVGAVLVERSVNQSVWETVRGGVELQVDSQAASLDDYEFAADMENFYRVTSVDPAPGLQLTGSSGGYASTPDTAALDITGDLEVWGYVALDDYTSGSDQALVAKWMGSGNQRSYMLYITGTGRLALSWSNDGTGIVLPPGRVDVNTTDPIDVTDGEPIALKATLDVDDGSGNSVVTFWRAETGAGPWTMIEQVTLSFTTSIFAGTADLEIGSTDGGTANLAAGTVLSAAVADGIATTPVADPDFSVQDSGDTSFDDDAGLTWTVNGSAEIVAVEEADSITPDLDGQVWLKHLRYPLLNRPIDVANWSAVGRRSRSGVFAVKGRSTPVAVHDLRGSREFTLTVWTDDMRVDSDVDPVGDAAALDLILAAGGTFFLQVPNGSPIPGGYVTIGDTSEDRVVRHGTVPRVFELPCTVVAPPGPEVTGTTLTWGTVQRLFGSWTALLAEHPTWSSLLAEIGDPDDLVVI